MHRAPIKVALLALPEVTASSLLGLLDLLDSVGKDWELLSGGAPADPVFWPRIVGLQQRRFLTHNGVSIEPQATLKDMEDADVVCVPNLWISADAEVAPFYPEVVPWLRRLNERGAVITSACTGSFLLAEAGLLDGEEATTHWAYCARFGERFPSIHVNPGRILALAGPGERIITAGGGSSWHDLGLYLVSRFAGQETAVRTAKLHLLDWRPNGQSAYAAMLRTTQNEDAVIARCQDWLADNYASPAPVGTMAAISGLPERTFKRRFRRATGLGPLEYVQSLRLEEAKQLLETSDQTIDEVAAACGYGDPRFFHKLFRRRTGVTAAEYRRRFRMR